MDTETAKTQYGILIDDMIKAGLGFGHQKSKLHPKMKDYTVKIKDKVYLVDLEKTAIKLGESLDLLKSLKQEGKGIMFVGTKIATRKLIQEIAEATKSYYVNERWIGGTFTNFKEIRKRINYWKELENRTKDPEYEKKYVKKERLTIQKEIDRMKMKFEGIRDMEELPGVLVVLSADKESIAVKEAKRCGIKVIGVVDTNTDPTPIDYIIPANDDAFTSIEYILYKMQEVLK
ncbi:MAG TPA: 30S ribosomal protein S2 [Candidatus Pacearchaeota archaeon]|nr:30S ribosomal protein S2 [Candidatus Parcubacteria bacterium]HNP79715.1 30S ribosomal protein S2 [Candidatus Pacearchaeota archaeon]HOC53858.1 30S ribosomal protein S2 [Candidatus Pacearchaeota archaeon]HQM24575.1 30S ribosomal protein S2 [Candidatus Pacearchaeota archaeon]